MAELPCHPDPGPVGADPLPQQLERRPWWAYLVIVVVVGLLVLIVVLHLTGTLGPGAR